MCSSNLCWFHTEQPMTMSSVGWVATPIASKANLARIIHGKLHLPRCGSHIQCFEKASAPLAPQYLQRSFTIDVLNARPPLVSHRCALNLRTALLCFFPEAFLAKLQWSHRKCALKKRKAGKRSALLQAPIHSERRLLVSLFFSFKRLHLERYACLDRHLRMALSNLIFCIVLQAIFLFLRAFVIFQLLKSQLQTRDEMQENNMFSNFKILSTIN